MMPASARAEWAAYWPLVLVGFLGSALNVMPIYLAGVFMAPVIATLGWSRSQYFSGLSIEALLIAPLIPVVGALVDRNGPRRIAIPGILLYCGTFAALSIVTGPIWQWWALWAFYAIGAAMVGTHIWTGAIQLHFDRARGTALAVALTGSGFAAAVLPLLGTALIARFGWRGAYEAMGVLALLLVLPPVVLFLRVRTRSAASSRPEGVVRPGFTVRAGLRSADFWRIAVSSILVFTPLIGIIVHFVPIVSAGGLAAPEAAVAAGLVGVGSVIGRLCAGPLLDRMRGALVGVGAILLIMVATALLLVVHGVPAVGALAAALVGAGLGAELNILAYLAARYWGMRSYATLFGFILAGLAVSNSAGALLAARMFDLTGSYSSFLGWVALPAMTIGLLLIATLGPYPAFSEPEA